MNFSKKERKKKQKRKNKTPSSRCLGTTFALVSNDFDSFVESFLEIISFIPAKAGNCEEET